MRHRIPMRTEHIILIKICIRIKVMFRVNKTRWSFLLPPPFPHTTPCPTPPPTCGFLYWQVQGNSSDAVLLSLFVDSFMWRSFRLYLFISPSYWCLGKAVLVIMAFHGYLHLYLCKYEPGHCISYKIACVSSEDSNQSAHERSLISLRKALCGFRRIESVYRRTAKTDHITKTRLYSFDSLKPHFYTVKLGFTGVYINSIISAQKHRLWVRLRPASPRRF